MMKRDDYKFLRLADAMTALNQRVNLIGIIVEYGAPTRSKGTGISIPYFTLTLSYTGISKLKKPYNVLT